VVSVASGLHRLSDARLRAAGQGQIRDLQVDAHANAVEKGFWDVTLVPKDSEALRPATLSQKKIAPCHAELSEALEALRKGGDENFGEEPADVVIRVADLAGGSNVDLEGEIAKKMAKNKDRPRLHGKAF
jgi:hypothetical protein